MPLTARFALVGLSLATAIGLSGCGCDRRVDVTVSYLGPVGGVIYDGFFSPTGDTHNYGGGNDVDVSPYRYRTYPCFDDSAEGEAPFGPGWRFVAWVDTDGDDAAGCMLWPLSGDCAPDPGEPQVEQEFELRRGQTAEIAVTFGGP